MKRTFVFAATAILLALASTREASAQGAKIGYINSQSILAEAPGAKEAQTKFDADMATYRTEVQQMQTELETLVPILFYGPPFKPGRYSGYTRTVDMAPTLARVLGITPGEPLDGRVLTAAIK